eukprot:CAMPEP_0178863522 /NCGR_PEP_ID=MMETSP0747-20121128/3397_1 /TAXON_ID=913974 /ORGANISM="Nitzschia punctata, Strain CCMP561" /LENGTH=181 /DNA_ID=CAMNT_0020530199 /DNA_START=172 /DNA_END=717 /DNA_ORIENTATION=-
MVCTVEASLPQASLAVQVRVNPFVASKVQQKSTETSPSQASVAVQSPAEAPGIIASHPTLLKLFVLSEQVRTGATVSWIVICWVTGMAEFPHVSVASHVRVFVPVFALQPPISVPSVEVASPSKLPHASVTGGGLVPSSTGHSKVASPTLLITGPVVSTTVQVSSQVSVTVVSPRPGADTV